MLGSHEIGCRALLEEEIQMVKVAMLILWASLLLACQSRSRHVTSDLVLPDVAERITIESHQRFLFPGELGALPAPAFPAVVDHRRDVDITVCLSFTVDAGGSTRDIRSEGLTGKRCANPAEHAVFVDAAIAAVNRWEFIAAAVCEYSSVEDARREDPECGHAQSVTAVPVRLAWTFRFVSSDGRRRVEASR